MNTEKPTICEEANSIVYGDRNKVYGHPLDNFEQTAALWSAILRLHVTAEQVGLCMIAVKLSRETNKHGRDNLVDIAGYAETVQRVVEERQRRELAVETFAPLTGADAKPA